MSEWSTNVRRVEPSEDFEAVEAELRAAGRCDHQTAYGLPWMEYCGKSFPCPDHSWSTWVQEHGDENWTNSRYPGWSVVGIPGGYEIRRLGVLVTYSERFAEAVEFIEEAFSDEH